MILLTILALIMVILIIVGVALASVGGALFFIIFGDIIVCAVIIGLIIRWVIKKKRK